ncbi:MULTISPECIES: hypothetical protein [Leptolyngbya]|uniref:hypothetical protein n=1 Tax=Leptolyngbya TaxID=47251 RepID=UPI00168650FD|nr:hypothetical protein [Leptolyngbya sp. FACHB-1624]MBD1859859.1 hypothetical protein [Leptolyngbya sp. FACHB-1624]
MTKFILVVQIRDRQLIMTQLLTLHNHLPTYPLFRGKLAYRKLYNLIFTAAYLKIHAKGRLTPHISPLNLQRFREQLIRKIHSRLNMSLAQIVQILDRAQNSIKVKTLSFLNHPCLHQKQHLSNLPMI